jgi:hypothetical protein
MIRNVIDMLQVSDFYKQSERIDIAKGKYAIPYNFKQLKKLIKRVWYG